MDSEIQGFCHQAFTGNIVYSDPMIADISMGMTMGEITSSLNQFMMDEKKIDTLVKQKYKDRLQKPDEAMGGLRARNLVIGDSVRHSQLPMQLPSQLPHFNFGRRGPAPGPAKRFTNCRETQRVPVSHRIAATPHNTRKKIDGWDTID